MSLIGTTVEFDDNEPRTGVVVDTAYDQNAYRFRLLIVSGGLLYQRDALDCVIVCTPLKLHVTAPNSPPRIPAGTLLSPRILPVNDHNETPATDY